MNLIEQSMSEITGYFMAPVLLLLIAMFVYSLLALGQFFYDLVGRYLIGAVPSEVSRVLSRDRQAPLETLEIAVLKELELLRIVSRVAPMLGLVATMIPMGPALIAVANGDSMNMAEQLVVAFAAVIVALVAASISFVVLSVRRRWLLSEINEAMQSQYGRKQETDSADLISGVEA
jgi:ABC-type multidrug transport system fused ATPase/permease subunit